MKSLRLLALAACAALAAPTFAQTFSNNWSFVDQLTGQTVSGVISGFANGDGLSADGLTITVMEAPYSAMLGVYASDLGQGLDTYSATNGVVTFASFLYTDENLQYLYVGTDPATSYYPELQSDQIGQWALNTDVGMQFSAVAGGVPEPASWAMMVGGFGLAGSAMRLRRQVFSAA